MQTWLSYHFYPLESPDVFLRRAVRPFLEQHVWPVKEARAFFIRYDDADQRQHIRLRLRGETEWLENTLAPALLQHFQDRGELKSVPYEPEPQRFGGTEALAWAEEYFHQSSRVVLNRFNQDQYTYGDALFDALRLHSMTAFAAGFDAKKTGWYFGKLLEQWIPLFFQPEDPTEKNDDWKADILQGFKYNFEPQKYTLVNALDRFWSDLQKDKIDKTQPEWLRWLRANQMILPEFGPHLEKALPSLIHLTNNRLGVNNQDEVYLNYILAKAFGG